MGVFVLFNVLFYGAGLVLLIYFGVRQYKKKKLENFENRDN